MTEVPLRASEICLVNASAVFWESLSFSVKNANFKPLEIFQTLRDLCVGSPSHFFFTLKGRRRMRSKSHMCGNWIESADLAKRIMCIFANLVHAN